MAEAKIRPPPPPQSDWAYFLDMDGTLIEIAETPDSIHVDDALLDLVWRLHGACDGAVALVSGRTLADLDRRVGGTFLAIAGQHGLERRSASGRVQTQAAPAAAKEEIARHLASIVARHPGLRLEDKGLTLAIHYRQAPRLASYVHRTLRGLVERCQEGLRLQKGKRVVEVQPAGFDKGSAIEEYLREPPFLGRRPVFIGDDVTDEHGFVVVNRLHGLSVKVGTGTTVARYRLPDVVAVRQWLATAPGGKNAERSYP
ncbi:MAG: trehalose-phosphatase [Rhodocyclaceae bacterium]|nr:trehalose-phosphatase [Rhodocyclaceae bacterium]